MVQSDFTNTTKASLTNSEGDAAPHPALPAIDLDGLGMPLPSRAEFLRQAGLLHDALISARPLLFMDYPQVVSAIGEGLTDQIELADAGVNWATSLVCLFETITEHLQHAAKKQSE